MPDATKGRSKRLLVLIIFFLFAVALRLGIAEYTLARVAERFPDSELYHEYALKIFHGQDYEVDGRHALRAPGYPVFLAGVWNIVGEPSLRATLWAQSVIGASAGLLVYGLTQSFRGTAIPSVAGWAAAILAMLEPISLALGAFELSETLFTTLLLLATLNFRWMCLHDSVALGGCAGLAFGLAVLVRPSLLLLGPAAVALLWITSSSNRTRIGLVLAITALILTLAPWWIYTARIYGSPVLTTLNVGESLYDGLNPRATGASDFWFKGAAETATMSERDEDRYWRKEAVRFAIDNPLRVASLSAVKWVRFWTPWPNEARYRRPIIVAPMAVYFAGVYAFALLGLWHARRQFSIAAWCLLPAVYFTCLHMVFVSSVRYRAPVMPMVCALAGVGIMFAWDRFGRSQLPTRNAP